MSSDRIVLPMKLAAAWPAARWQNVSVLVAVSGGADSVALLRALHAVRLSGEGRLIVAHYNHRLRGAESDADEAFVNELAKQLGVQFVVGAASSDLAASGSGEGIEGAARQARYGFLASAAGQVGARYIATAHTADDHVETILFNILRGTGLAGLAGIPRIRKLTDAATIIRPQLDVTRAEVLDYLNSIGQPYRDDSTNRLEDYTRNRIRLQLLPLLERDYNPRVREALLRLAQIAGQTDELLGKQATELLALTSRSAPGGVEIDLAPLAGASPALVRQALFIAWQEQGWPLQDMSLAKWDQLSALAQSADTAIASSPQTFPGGIRAERARGLLWLSRISA
jgi:tRNA(Ile)-lysidine synthase